jgi:hypothetical protein
MGTEREKMGTHKEPEEIPTQRPHQIIEEVNKKINNIIKTNANYKKAFIEVEKLIQKAVDPEKTKNMYESLDCLYEALDICKKVRKHETKE